MKNSLILLIIYAGYLVLMSLISMYLFKKDKKMAQKNGNEVRIKEKTLLTSVAIGGALGGFIGRILFHHKTDKKYFSFIIYISLLLQVLTLVAMIICAII
jgi:uncharacterized membrane protein YsdA (DUF1294 family)